MLTKYWYITRLLPTLLVLQIAFAPNTASAEPLAPSRAIQGKMVSKARPIDLTISSRAASSPMMRFLN